MGVAVTTPDLEPVSHRPGPFRSRLFPYALIAPSVTMIAGILAFPLGMLVWLSLQHYGLKELIAHQGRWVGLDNFRVILADQTFQQVVVRTVVFTFANVALTIIFSTLIALLMLKV